MDQSQKSFSKNLREMWYEKHENFTTAAENRWMKEFYILKGTVSRKITEAKSGINR